MNLAALRARITEHEGRRRHVYTCTAGHPSIGVGFNLDRPDARARLSAVGADYDAVRAGRADLTDEQVDRLLDGTLAEAITGASGLVSGFADLPDAAQAVLVDMVFNLGAAGVRKFRRMLAAVARRDWLAAAAEMESSLWFRQVGRRGRALVADMRGLAA